MTIFYSATAKTFFDLDIHGIDSIPDGAVEISKETHQRLLDDQSKGKIITSNKNGEPITIDRPPKTEQELNAESNALIQISIEEIERDKQPRALRDYLLNGDKKRLEEVNSEIAALRAKLK